MSMYDLNNPEVKEDGNQFEVFPLGIVEDNTLEAIEIANTKEGNPYLKFTFKNPNGATLNHLEFENVIDSTKSADEIAALEKKVRSQVTRLKHIVTKILPANTPLPAASSFNDLIQKIKLMCPEAAYGNKKFRLLTNYNYKNFVSLPAMVPFMEDGNIPLADSKLKITKLHKMVPDQATTTTELTAAAGAASDLPF